MKYLSEPQPHGSCMTNRCLMMKKDAVQELRMNVNDEDNIDNEEILKILRV